MIKNLGLLMPFLALIFCVSGCNIKVGRDLNSTLDAAEGVINDDPALAFSLLDSIHSNSIWRRKDMARYALLYTEAQYKTYRPIETDSLIMIPVCYYSQHRNLDLLFRSYFYLGCVYSLSECLTEAAVAFAQAEELIDYADSDFRRGLLYSRMADVYYDSFDYTRAEPYYLKAADCFKMAGKEYHMICAKGLAANCLASFYDYKNSNTLNNEVIDWANRVDNLDMLRMYMTNKMSNLVYDDNLADAKLLHDSIISRFGFPESHQKELYQFARYYIKSGEYTKARTMLDKAWTFSPADTVSLYYAESLLSDSLGQKDLALSFYRLSMQFDKTKVNGMLYQPIMGAQRDYYRTLSELEAVKANNRRAKLIIAVIIMLLIIVSSSFIRVNRKRKMNEQINHYLYAINEHTAKIETLNSKVRSMFRQQYSQPDYLFTRFYDQVDDAKKAERLYKVVKNQIDDFKSPKNIARIDAMLHDIFGNLIDKLTSPEIGLSEKDLLLIRFVLAKISAKSMAVILDDSNQNINQRKKRMLEKIGSKDPALLIELNNALNS